MGIYVLVNGALLYALPVAQIAGPVWRADHCQKRRPSRMRVHDRLDIGTYPIDFRMDVELERRPGTALDEVAVEIDGDDVVGRQRATRRRGRIDVKRSAVAPRATVTAVVDDVRARQHADRIDQLLSGFLRFHVRLA